MTDGLLPVPRPRGRFPRIIQATFQLPLCLYWVLLFDVDDVGVERQRLFVGHSTHGFASWRQLEGRG